MFASVWTSFQTLLCKHVQTCRSVGTCVTGTCRLGTCKHTAACKAQAGSSHCTSTSSLAVCSHANPPSPLVHLTHFYVFLLPVLLISCQRRATICKSSVTRILAPSATVILGRDSNTETLALAFLSCFFLVRQSHFADGVASIV